MGRFKVREGNEFWLRELIPKLICQHPDWKPSTFVEHVQSHPGCDANAKEIKGHVVTKRKELEKKGFISGYNNDRPPKVTKIPPKVTKKENKKENSSYDDLFDSNYEKEMLDRGFFIPLNSPLLFESGPLPYEKKILRRRRRKESANQSGSGSPEFFSVFEDVVWQLQFIQIRIDFVFDILSALFFGLLGFLELLFKFIATLPGYGVVLWDGLARCGVFLFELANVLVR